MLQQIVTFEYFAGPADAQREQLLIDPGRLPSPLRVVSMPARYGSALDSEPTVPAENHRYLRAGDRPHHDGMWRYHWAGPIH